MIPVMGTIHRREINRGKINEYHRWGGKDDEGNIYLYEFTKQQNPIAHHDSNLNKVYRNRPYSRTKVILNKNTWMEDGLRKE